MDLKELNKPQLILLAILLSFITSIVTGITTVSLMEQAPSSITTPINRVVQQTVQKIVQVEGKTSQQTVIIKEEDLVVDAIAKNKSSVFIATKQVVDPNNSGMVEVSAGRGFAVSKDGIVAVDATLVPGDGNYFVKNDSGKFFATFLSTDKAGFSFLKIGSPVDKTSKPVFTPVSFGDLSKIKVGQKIIILGSSINSFIFDGNKDMKLSGITRSNGGSLVLDLDGDVLGMALSGPDTAFAPADAIASSLATLIGTSQPAAASNAPTQ